MTDKHPYIKPHLIALPLFTPKPGDAMWIDETWRKDTMTDKHTAFEKSCDCKAIRTRRTPTDKIQHCPTHEAAPEVIIELGKSQIWIAKFIADNNSPNYLCRSAKRQLHRNDLLLSRINSKGGE